ncbi:MAG: PEP-CTERM sorting domain-containing protein [Rivularia sp. (in: cyanobacteria)]
MSKKARSIKNFFIVAAPILASSIFGISPVKAATLAFSNSEVEFTNFSQAASNVGTFTEADTLAIGKGGMAVAIAQAEAVFVIEPAEAFNSSLSLALGESQDYLAVAESQASVIGNFDIEANTNFSLDFLADLELVTSIDNPPKENARASGEISFALVDTQNNDVLEFFNLVGNIVTEGDNDFVGLKQSDNVILSDIFSAPGFGGLEEFLAVSIEGSLERYFADETTVALVEVKRNRARVTAPEPSASLALLISSGVVWLVLKRRSK